MPDDYDQNPFAESDADRRALWHVLVHNDIEAFLDCDWDRHAADFEPDGFFGINAEKSDNSDAWRLAFPTLNAYRENWLGFARQSAGRAEREISKRSGSTLPDSADRTPPALPACPARVRTRGRS